MSEIGMDSGVLDPTGSRTKTDMTTLTCILFSKKPDRLIIISPGIIAFDCFVTDPVIFF